MPRRNTVAVAVSRGVANAPIPYSTPMTVSHRVNTGQNYRVNVTVDIVEMFGSKIKPKIIW